MMNEQALKDRLQTIAKEKEIHFNACWKQLLLERFLVRLSQSRYADTFIFKGGFLLSFIMKIGRETMDLDFLLTRMNAETEALKTEKLSFLSAVESHFSRNLFRF